MSNAAASGAAEAPTRVDVSVDGARLDRAVDAGEYDDRAAFVEEAVRQLIADVLDEDGQLECPHDDCDRTFPTRRQLRGHLGSSEHAVDVPDGDFWCGYCGYGPTSWRGVNAHHGQSNHDGDPVRFDEEPSRDDLLAPDDVPDHKNPELLERLYAEHDGSYTEMCRAHDFDVGPGRVRHYLIEYDIHDVTPHGEAADDGPVYRDPEWLQERYDEADGNISEMHRRIDIDVPYRTLVKNLKRFDVHDPTESPGRKQSTAEQRDDVDGDADGDDDVDEDPNEAQPGVDVPESEEVFVLEWGRWGPPHGGTYHLDDDCWVINRSDSDRDVVALPWPQDEIEDDEDWEVCGHCEPATEDDADDATQADEPGQEQEDVDSDPGGVTVQEDADDTSEPVEEDTTSSGSDISWEPAEDDQDGADDTSRFDDVIVVDDPADATGFEDLETPDWLAEASFHLALEMSADAAEFSESLGWGDPDDLQLMVEVLDLEDEFTEGDA